MSAYDWVDDETLSREETLARFRALGSKSGEGESHQCETPCDRECEAACHEQHQPQHKREH